jgi:hypothetical protein
MLRVLTMGSLKEANYDEPRLDIEAVQLCTQSLYGLQEWVLAAPVSCFRSKKLDKPSQARWCTYLMSMQRLS